MNLKNIFNKNAWSGMFHGFGMKVVQVKPEIKLVVGGLSLLFGTIYACTKTEQAKEAIEEAKQQANEIEATVQVQETETIQISPETKKQLKFERGKQYVSIYGRMLYKLVKLYGVPAILWFGGMGMVVGGHCDLRKMNTNLVADIFAGNQLLKEYRERVGQAVGKEVEEKIFLGAQEGMVNVIETDPETGKEKLVQKQADVFVNQPGSIFARNFTPETTDIMWRSFTEEYLDARVKEINDKLDTGWTRGYNGMEIYRMLGFNENALGMDAEVDALLRNGISANPIKVPDPEMRHLKITKLRGFRKKWDEVRRMEVYEPCLRIDANFYPLEGKI